MDDIIINKVASIKNCIKRAKEEFNNSDNFQSDYSAQDAAILNIVRACEQAIDLANHLVKLLDLGVPNNSSDAFEMLSRKRVIDDGLSQKLIKMTGFRNVMIHEYQKINLEIVVSVINKNLNDLLEFTNLILKNNSQKS